MGRLKTLLVSTKSQIDKYHSLKTHLDQESQTLDENDQFQFGETFEEFREILGYLVDSSQTDSKIQSLNDFLLPLMDNLEEFISKKKEIHKVARLETEEFISRVCRANREALELFDFIESTSREPDKSRSASPFRENSMQGGLSNLRKSLAVSPRINSQDETTIISTDREFKRENNDLRLENETLRHQIEILKSEIDSRDNSMKEQLKIFDLKAKSYDVKLSGHLKLVQDKMETYTSRINLLESLLSQVQKKSSLDSNQHAESNKKAMDDLIKSLTDKIESLESANYTSKLE